MSTMTSRIEQHISTTNADLTARLRARAQSVGWPTNVVRTLRVDVRKDSPVRITRAAQDLEYGTEGKAPSPVIRAFLEKDLPAAYERLLDETFPLGEVI